MTTYYLFSRVREIKPLLARFCSSGRVRQIYAGLGEAMLVLSLKCDMAPWGPSAFSFVAFPKFLLFRAPPLLWKMEEISYPRNVTRMNWDETLRVFSSVTSKQEGLI